MVSWSQKNLTTLSSSGAKCGPAVFRKPLLEPADVVRDLKFKRFYMTHQKPALRTFQIGPMHNSLLENEFGTFEEQASAFLYVK